MENEIYKTEVKLLKVNAFVDLVPMNVMIDKQAIMNE
jgi:hypothetical protein